MNTQLDEQKKLFDAWADKRGLYLSDRSFYWEGWQAAISHNKALSDGWVAVPKEPSDLQLSFMAANWGTSKHHAGSLQFAKETYKAMLAAAPSDGDR